MGLRIANFGLRIVAVLAVLALPLLVTGQVKEGARSLDRVKIAKTRPGNHESAHFWDIDIKIEKFHGERQPGQKPYAVVHKRGNALAAAGLTRLGNLLIGTAATQGYDSTHSRIGVGDDSTANSSGSFGITNSDLVAATGSTHRQWKLVDATPTVSNNVITFHATFGTSEANFHWQEFGIDQGTADAVLASTAPLLNRKVTDFGTKTSSGSWALTATITIS